MQAVFLFALYGFFYAAIASFVSIGTLDALALQDQYIKDTEQFFEDLESMISQDIIPREMAMPNFGNNVQSYLGYTVLRQRINWNHGADLTRDPWGQEIDGFVVTERVAIASQSGGGFVHIPVTAFVLVSSGPDLQISPALQTELDNLGAGSSIRDVTRIEAAQGTDDIVRTFTTFKAQQVAWKDIQLNMESLSGGLSAVFFANYKAFVQELKRVYGTAYTQFFANEGRLIYNAANQASWTSNGITVSAPSLSALENNPEQFFAGEVEALTSKNLRLTAKAYASPSGRCTGGSAPISARFLRLCLTNNGSPWGNASGDLFYFIDIEVPNVYN